MVGYNSIMFFSFFLLEREGLRREGRYERDWHKEKRDLYV